MIVRRTGAAPIFITQPDHAALAARIMAHWRAGGFPTSPRREVILLAIAEHDNGWQEVDAAPIVDASGEVLDFMTVPMDIRRGVWPRGVARLASQPYAAALVAQHALHVYRRYRANADWHPFFAEMESARDHHLRAAQSMSLDDLLADYAFVRIGDLLSLTFCNAWTAPQTEEFGYTIRLDADRLRVGPDPFEGASLAIEVAGRTVAPHEGPVTIRGIASGEPAPR